MKQNRAKNESKKGKERKPDGRQRNLRREKF